MLSTEQRIGDDIILDRMYATEQTLLTQADALDMKASYLLIVLVFLAQLSATFIARHDLSWMLRGSQWLSCLMLTISGVFLLLELKVRPFRREDALGLEKLREEVITQAKGLEQYQQAAHPNEYVRSRLLWSLLNESKVRIGKNENTNAKKVTNLQRAYALAAVAFLLDILFILQASQLYSYL